MEKMSSWLPRASATTGLLLLIASGCMKDLDALSAKYGHAGASGKGGAGGKSGGSSLGGEAGSGEGGEAGQSTPDETGGKGGSGATGGKGGSDATGGSGTCTMCGDSEECIDVSVGTPDGSNGITNCGDCDITCSLDNVENAKCTAGVCAPQCVTGFGNCNTAANDGCETDLTTTANCGLCARACSQIGTASTECVSGRCTPTCTPGYADCNGDAQPVVNDGCEFFLEALDRCTTSCSATAVACEATKVCNSGACVAPAGVVALSTPLANQSDAQRFSDVFPLVPINLEGTSITVRLYAPGATGGSLSVFMSDNSSNFGPTTTFDLLLLSTKWTDVTIPCTSAGAFDVKITKQINLLVQGGATAMTNPTVVYVDSVRTSNLAINDTFDASSGGFVKSSYVFVMGSAITWSATMP